MKRLIILLILISAGTASAYPVNPAAYWPLDETSGPNWIETVGGYDINALPSDISLHYTDGVIRNAMKWDAFTSAPYGYTDTGTESIGGTAMTIAFWVRDLDPENYNLWFANSAPSRENGWMVLSGFWTASIDYDLFITVTGSPQGQCTAYLNAGAVDWSGWHCVVITYDQSATPQSYIYVDGVDVTSGRNIESLIPLTSNSSIYLQLTGEGDMAIDEIGVWNRVLTSDEIACLLDPNLCEDYTQVSLTASSTVGGTVSAPGVGTYIYDLNAVVTIVAEPCEGYHFVNWTITEGAYSVTFDDFPGEPERDGIFTRAEYSDGNAILLNGFPYYYHTLANPSPPPRVLWIDRLFYDDPNWTIWVMITDNPAILFVSPTIVGTYSSDSYLDAHVSNSDSNVITDANDANTTILMNASYTITANFAVGGSHTLTYTTDGGGTISGVSPQTIDWGQDGNEVNAVPDGVGIFLIWSDGVLTSNRTDTNVFADACYMAYFQPPTYTFRTLTTSTDSNGTITTPGIGTYWYNDGNTVDIIAEANEHCHFNYWSGTAVDAGKVNDVNAASTTVFMDANYTVMANFDINQYSLTVFAGTGGAVSPSGVTWYDYNTIVPIVATPRGGYSFVNWTVLGTTITDANSASTTALVDANCIVTANFIKDSGVEICAFSVEQKP
jgi:hypothetical protein